MENKTEIVKHVLQMQQISFLPNYKNVFLSVFFMCVHLNRCHLKVKPRTLSFIFCSQLLMEITWLHVQWIYQSSQLLWYVCKFCMWLKYVAPLTALWISSMWTAAAFTLLHKHLKAFGPQTWMVNFLDHNEQSNCQGMIIETNYT